MFRPLESKFVNFTRFAAIFDAYKPYDAIYKRAFAGVFLSDVNKNSYCRLVRHPTCTITPKAGWWTKHAWEIHKVSYVNAIPKSIDDQQISLVAIMGFRMIFTNSMNGIRTACSTRRKTIYRSVREIMSKPPNFMTVCSNGYWRNAKKYIIPSFIVEPNIDGSGNWLEKRRMNGSIFMTFRRDDLEKNFLMSDFTTVLSRMAVWRNNYEAIVLPLRSLRTGTLKKDLSTEFLSSPTLPKWCILARLRYPWTNQKERLREDFLKGHLLFFP